MNIPELLIYQILILTSKILDSQNSNVSTCASQESSFEDQVENVNIILLSGTVELTWHATITWSPCCPVRKTRKVARENGISDTIT